MRELSTQELQLVSAAVHQVDHLMETKNICSSERPELVIALLNISFLFGAEYISRQNAEELYWRFMEEQAVAQVHREKVDPFVEQYVRGILTARELYDKIGDVLWP